MSHLTFRISLSPRKWCYFSIFRVQSLTSKTIFSILIVRNFSSRLQFYIWWWSCNFSRPTKNIKNLFSRSFIVLKFWSFSSMMMILQLLLLFKDATSHHHHNCLRKAWAHLYCLVPIARAYTYLRSPMARVQFQKHVHATTALCVNFARSCISRVLANGSRLRIRVIVKSAFRFCTRRLSYDVEFTTGYVSHHRVRVKKYLRVRLARRGANAISKILLNSTSIFLCISLSAVLESRICSTSFADKMNCGHFFF